MRQAFFETLADLAESDPRIVLLTADLGFMALEPFSRRHPCRFINAGVAEQNMIGLAAGLAEAGFRPFVYSIAPFAALRPFEFIRNSVVATRLPVRVVGVGGGFDYSTNGISHYGLDDLGALRVLPDFPLYVPADAAQTVTALRHAALHDGPLYFRLSKSSIAVPGLDGGFASIRTLADRDNSAHARQWQAKPPAPPHVLLVALGPSVHLALEAASLLDAQGISAAVDLVSQLNVPLPSLPDRLAEFRLAVTIEEQFINGALGSTVCECVAEHGVSTRVLRCGVESMPDGRIGSTPAWLREQHGLDPAAIARRVRKALS